MQDMEHPAGTLGERRSVVSYFSVLPMLWNSTAKGTHEYVAQLVSLGAAF